MKKSCSPERQYSSRQSPGSASWTAPEKGPILTFQIEGVHPLDLATFLDLKNIALRSGHLCAQPLLRAFGLEAAARASFGIYNTLDEVDRFCEALKEAVRNLIVLP